LALGLHFPFVYYCQSILRQVYYFNFSARLVSIKHSKGGSYWWCMLGQLIFYAFTHGILKGEVSLVPLTSCLTGLDQSVLQIETKIVSSHAADSKPVKQEVNGTVILPPLVFPGFTWFLLLSSSGSLLC
jgi:hypothetical protein